MLAMPAMLCSPAAAMGAEENDPTAVPPGKVEVAEKENVDVGYSEDAAVKALTRTLVARPRLPAVMAASPKPPMVVPLRSDATGVARRAIGGSTARRRYAADAADGATLLMSAPHNTGKLCWRRRTTMIIQMR